MKKLLYKVIFMMTFFGVVDAMASNQPSISTVQITNNSLDGVALKLYDAAGNLIHSNSINPGASYPVQSSYQQYVKCRNLTAEECIKRNNEAPSVAVKSIQCTFNRSRLSFTIPMPTSPIDIISSDHSIVTLINNSTDDMRASFYDKNGKPIYDVNKKPTISFLTYADGMQTGGPIDRVYIPSNVATITFTYLDSHPGYGFTFSISRPTQASLNIFSNDQHDQLVKVTNNSKNFVNATLPDGNIIQFTSPGQSHYIPTTVGHMSIAKSLGDGTFGPAQNIIMQEADFNLFV